MAYQGLARRFKFLRQSLLRHGPGHVIEVFRQAAVRRRYARAPVDEPGSDALLSYYAAADVETLVATIAQGAARRLPMTLARRKEFTVSLVTRAEGYDAILENAERFSDGRFLALGISTLAPEGEYDWHRDYGSSNRWPSIPFDRVRFAPGSGADVKYPWELSRCYWIWWLGKAYWISSNSAWSREFVRQIDAWRTANPVNVGVNWAMPMEVGIRSFWLSMGFGLFHGAPNINAAWWVDYLRHLWSHGTYLQSNLEYFSNLTNHYIANCFGLVAVGALFADCEQGRSWLMQGRSRLESEIDHQILPDGSHYERSLPYHKLVLEMYLISATLLERSGAAFAPRTIDAIERMSAFLCDVASRGVVPQIGDADDGVILRASQDGDPYDARDVAAIASVMFDRADFAHVAGEFTPGAILMTGGEGFERYQGLLSKRPNDDRSSRLYRDGGFAVMRSAWMTVVADCGPIGLHGNNDTLAFVLRDERGDIVIDPGTYCYTRSERLRNTLRSTAAHNAPAIDGREIAEFDGLWRVRSDRTRPRILRWSATPPSLQAQHEAYAELGIIVSREWSLNGDSELEIVDALEGDGAHEIVVRFTLDPTITARSTAKDEIALVRDGVDIGRLRTSHSVEASRGWFSPSYGVAAMTDVIEVRTRIELPCRISYIWSLLPTH